MWEGRFPRRPCDLRMVCTFCAGGTVRNAAERVPGLVPALQHSSGMLRRCALLAALLLAAPAPAEPMRLDDPTPRWVLMQLEDSPREHPEQLDTVWAPPLLAWLAPESDTGLVRVTLPASLVESHLMAPQGPRPGSFGDFVWILDPASGHVLSATLSGTVRRELHWGPFRSHTYADILVEMTTLHPMGFEAPRTLLGQVVFHACQPADASSACTPVRPAPYDPHTGYVNAVGRIRARSKGVTTENFASLGEARFFELPRSTPGPVAAGPRP